MKKFFQHNSITRIFSLTMIVLMCTFASVAHAQYTWAPPTSNPPADNTPPPVNIAGQDQVKSGWLKTGSFFGDKKLGADKITATEFCLEPSASLIEAWTHGGSNLLSNNASCVTNSTGWGTGGGAGINPGNTLGDTLYWDGTEWLPSNNFFNNAVFTAAFNFFLPGLSVGSSSALALCVEPDGQVVTCGTPPPPPPPSGHLVYAGSSTNPNIINVTSFSGFGSVTSMDNTTAGQIISFSNGSNSGNWVYYAHPTSCSNCGSLTSGAHFLLNGSSIPAVWSQTTTTNIGGTQYRIYRSTGPITGTTGTLVVQ